MRNTKTRLPYRRKREGKTNYKRRLTLLKGHKDRLVIRKTNKYIILQIVRYEPDGDRIMAAETSKTLQKKGWKHSCKCMPACYLAGVLLGNKAKEKKLKEAVLDIGLLTPINGSRIYAVLKGVVDSGVIVPSSEDIFPSEERINGSHISEEVHKDFESTKKSIMKA